MRSSGLVDLWGHRIRLDAQHTYRYVRATIGVRANEVVVITGDGEVVHTGASPSPASFAEGNDVLLLLDLRIMRNDVVPFKS